MSRGKIIDPPPTHISHHILPQSLLLTGWYTASCTLHCLWWMYYYQTEAFFLSLTHQSVNSTCTQRGAAATWTVLCFIYVDSMNVGFSIILQSIFYFHVFIWKRGSEIERERGGGGVRGWALYTRWHHKPTGDMTGILNSFITHTCLSSVSLVV